MAGKLFEVADYKVKAGERVNGSLGSVYLPDGTRVGVSFVAVNGKEDGPTLCVSCAVHGTEIVGIGSMIRVFKELNPDSLRGTLVAIMGSNPFAVQVGSYITHLDFKNISSTVMKNAPADGSVTDRIGAAVSRALRASDLVIDVHANPLPCIDFVLGSLKVAKDDKTRERITRMVDAWGTTRIYSNRETAGSLRDFCSEEGIAAITPELSGGNFLFDWNTEVGVIGVTNVMKEFNMIDGDLQPQKCKVVTGGDWRSGGKLRTHTGGFMFPKVEPGEILDEGTTVAEMYDVFGQLLEEVKIPFRGAMWSFTGGPGATHALIEGDDIGYTFCDVKDWTGAGREVGGRGK